MTSFKLVFRMSKLRITKNSHLAQYRRRETSLKALHILGVFRLFLLKKKQTTRRTDTESWETAKASAQKKYKLSSVDICERVCAGADRSRYFLFGFLAVLADAAARFSVACVSLSASGGSTTMVSDPTSWPRSPRRRWKSLRSSIICRTMKSTWNVATNLIARTRRDGRRPCSTYILRSTRLCAYQAGESYLLQSLEYFRVA